MAHATELGNEVPAEPLLFLKPPSSLVGPGDAIVLPPDVGEVHYEGEIGVLIGRSASWVSEDADPTRGIALGDIDNDGDIDFIAGNAAAPLKAYANTQGVEINMSPLIDCVFLLLIFFVVTTVFVEETGVEVDKPAFPSFSITQILPYWEFW